MNHSSQDIGMSDPQLLAASQPSASTSRKATAKASKTIPKRIPRTLSGPGFDFDLALTNAKLATSLKVIFANGQDEKLHYIFEYAPNVIGSSSTRSKALRELIDLHSTEVDATLAIVAKAEEELKRKGKALVLTDKKTVHKLTVHTRVSYLFADLFSKVDAGLAAIQGLWIVGALSDERRNELGKQLRNRVHTIDRAVGQIYTEVRAAIEGKAAAGVKPPAAESGQVSVGSEIAPEAVALAA